MPFFTYSLPRQTPLGKVNDEIVPPGFPYKLRIGKMPEVLATKGWRNHVVYRHRNVNRKTMKTVGIQIFPNMLFDRYFV